MKDEEMAEEYAEEKVSNLDECRTKDLMRSVCKDGFLAGLKAGRPQWHKITDWKDNSQFPKDELTTYLVRLYQDHYVICDLEITEGYRQFYLSDNLDAIDPIQW